MSASELAFMALGLLLGAAAGAALIVVPGTRSLRREIRVTVTRDAVPRRSETLSHDAFLAHRNEPAPGGPGDRRGVDRASGATPVAGEDAVPTGGAASSGSRAANALPPWPGVPADRTIVPTSGPAAAPGSARGPVAVPIHREPDPALAALRHGVPFGQATLPEPRDASPNLATERAATLLATADAVAAPRAVAWNGPPRGSGLERMLRGDHRAMVEVVDAVAGIDGHRRREWEVLLGGLVEALADAAARESVMDFPMGTAFWDTFTIEQCRRIAASLASMGHAYDGRDGWVDNRVPAYRDVAQALADVGIEPRRVRSWPDSTEIANLYVGARPAPEELLPAAGPDYTAANMALIVGERAEELGDLWLAWEEIKPHLLEESVPAGARPAVEAPITD